MRSFRNTTIRSFFYCLLIGSAAATGCGEEQLAKPQVDLIDKVSHALSVNTVRAIKGTYGAGCISRSGTWALGLNSYTPAEGALSVVKNNSACSLAVTEVHAGTLATPDLYTMTAPLDLGASYPTNGSAFLLNGLGDTVFFANFRIQPDMGFSTNFTLEMVYSDDSTEVTASKAATYAVQAATATSGNVPPPDYTISMSGITIQVDAEDVVQSATGTALLTDGMFAGEQYVVDADTLSATPSFAEVDAIFAAGSQKTLMGANPTIPAADFGLGGIDLTAPKTRNVIVANIENGTRSYQIFRVTFNHP